jgi:cullin 4
MSESQRGREKRRSPGATNRDSIQFPAKRSRAARASPSHVTTAGTMFTPQTTISSDAAGTGAPPPHASPCLQPQVALDAVRGMDDAAGANQNADAANAMAERGQSAASRSGGGVGNNDGRPAPKKFTIRPFSRAPKIQANFLADAWNQYLQPAVLAVLASETVPHSLELLYRKVEDVCMQKQAPELYSRLRAACDKHASDELRKLEGLLVDSDAFLRLVDDTWLQHCSQMLRIRAIFLHLDRTYVVQGGETNTRNLWDMSLQQFRAHFENASGVKAKSIKSLLALINRERDGETVDQGRLRSLLRMLTAIGTYEQAFQDPFIIASSDYYRAESKNLFAEMDVPVYLRHAERRLGEESDRANQVLDASTRVPLISLCEQRLVKDHVNAILKKGFRTMCEERRKDDLERCYTLLARANRHYRQGEANAHAGMRHHVTAYVKRVGSAIVMDQSKDSEMVPSLLALKAQLDDIVNMAFGGSDLFAHATNSAFESFVNARENKPAELIAKYLDGMLRTGNKGYSEEELENTLDRVLTLFRFIDGKDVFEAFYKKDLSKRLLYDKSASHDLEKVMISKLKAECGSQFTSKLEAMFRDVDASTDLMKSFRQQSRSEAGNSTNKADLAVYVLEASRWPLTTQLAEVNLPLELIEYQESYKRFYLSKHSGRKLTWQHFDGSCAVKAYFPKGAKILSLSLYQTVVAMLFNGMDELSYSQIAASSRIDASELKRTLLSLACGKVRVLQKQPKGPSIGESDEFVFNHAFAHKQTRIKVNAIQMKETVEENTGTTEKVFQERSYQIDASIVRIMKTRKVLTHLELVTEVYGQLRFPHKPADIKKRIESLIEREYMERNPDNATQYKYVA